MKINTQRKLVDLKGKPFADNATIGDVIGDVLSRSTIGGQMKLYILAKRFAKAEGSLELDAADLELVKKALEDSRNIPLVTGQVLECLSEVREESGKGKK